MPVPAQSRPLRLTTFALVAAVGSACAPEPSIPEVSLGASDFAFSLPDTVPGGLVRFHFANHGAEPHHAQFVRLNDGVTRSQFDSVFGVILEAVPTEGYVAFFRLFEVATMAGGPSSIGPGLSGEVTLDLATGEYTLLCFVASPDGLLHLAKGMRRWLTVGDPPERAPAPPVSAGRVDMADFVYREMPAIDTGEVVLEVVNSGQEPHEMAVVRLEGISFDDALSMMIGPRPEGEAAPAGPPPFRLVGGMQGIMPGQHAWVTLHLEPGNYALVCYIPSPANEGKSHMVLGMVRPFTVG